ncbi:MAG: hypothetical protein ACREBG_12735 [Pyrinomonadaceae bacterium]
MSAARRNAIVVVPLFLILGWSVLAQSGRRPPQSTKAGTTTKTEPEVPPTVVAPPSSHTLKHPVRILVARQFTSKHQPSEDTIYASLIKRLNEFTNVSGMSIGDTKRQEAILRAREEEEALVVFVQFEVDNLQEGRLVLNSPDLEVKYFVFLPGSGKQETKGKVYYQAIGGAKARKDNWPKGPPIRITAEATGIEAAERVHDWLIVATRMPAKP